MAPAKRTKPTKLKQVSRDTQTQAFMSIEERIYCHTCAVSAISTKTGFPETGTATAIRWKGRTFLITADHVIRDYADTQLRFAFRPPGTLRRADWWQSSKPGTDTLIRAVPVQIIARFRSRKKDDLAALEVPSTLEAEGRIMFFDLDEGSKVLRPIGSSVGAIGFPFDSLENVAPLTAAFTGYALWGMLCVLARTHRRSSIVARTC